MTKVEFIDDDNKIVIKAHGHACFRESYDIVCASLSYLVQSFSWYTGAKYKACEGLYYTKIDNPNDNDRIVFDYIRKSIGYLADQFPDNVTVLGEK